MVLKNRHRKRKISALVFFFQFPLIFSTLFSNQMEASFDSGFFSYFYSESNASFLHSISKIFFLCCIRLPLFLFFELSTNSFPRLVLTEATNNVNMWTVQHLRLCCASDVYILNVYFDVTVIFLNFQWQLRGLSYHILKNKYRQMKLTL